jgi:hypothetical protein
VTSSRVFAGTTVALGVVALAHAAVTWPPSATLAFFGGGALVAFLAEAVAVNLGWLEHHVGPKVAGVPVYLLFGWTGTVYVAFRVARIATGEAGAAAVAVAAVLATTYDVLTDHRGVEDGHWTYIDDFPGPPSRGPVVELRRLARRQRPHGGVRRPVRLSRSVSPGMLKPSLQLTQSVYSRRIISETCTETPPRPRALLIGDCSRRPRGTP